SCTIVGDPRQLKNAAASFQFQRGGHWENGIEMCAKNDWIGAKAVVGNDHVADSIRNRAKIELPQVVGKNPRTFALLKRRRGDHRNANLIRFDVLLVASQDVERPLHTSIGKDPVDELAHYFLTSIVNGSDSRVGLVVTKPTTR